jgi:hypothetical protein
MEKALPKIAMALVLMISIGLSLSFEFGPQSFGPKQTKYIQNFESGTLGNWTNSSLWIANTATTPLNGSYSMFFQGTGTGNTRLFAANQTGGTSGWQGIQIIATVKTNALDSGENITLSVTDGTTWYLIWGAEDVDAQTDTWNLNTTFDNKAGFGVNWTCNSNGGSNERCWVDDFAIRGTPLGGLRITNLTIAPVNGSSVAMNQYSLFNVTATAQCNGGSTGECGDVNASLYYNSTNLVPNKLVNTTAGATPFYLQKNQYSQNSTYYDYMLNSYSPTFSTARSTAYASGNTSSILQIGIVGEVWNGIQYIMERYFLRFDTSTLPTDAVITSVNLRLTEFATSTTIYTNFTVQIGDYKWTEPISTTTMDTEFDGCLNAPKEIFGNTSDMQNDVPYTSNNLNTSWINKTGYTYYCLISQNDTDNRPINNTPFVTNSTEKLGFYSNKVSNPDSYKPILIINYTIGNGTNPSTCSAMLQGQNCTATWQVNATGAPSTQYWLNVSFNSESSYILSNSTNNFQINISAAGPATYAFTITVPGNNYSNSSTTPWGGGNPVMNFTYNGTWGGTQSYVNCSFNYSGATYWQNTATPALKFTNLGSTALTWTIAMNNSLPSWVTLFANDTSAIPSNAFVFSDSNSLALPVAASGTKSLWVYANFSGVADYGGTVNYTQLNHTST